MSNPKMYSRYARENGTFSKLICLSPIQVCDEPHPILIKDMLDHCVKSDIDESFKLLNHLWKLGYSSEDIITSVFRVCKTHNMAEFIKLEFIKEIGLTHLSLVQGTQSLLQLSGMLARLCQVSIETK